MTGGARIALVVLLLALAAWLLLPLVLALLLAGALLGRLGHRLRQALKGAGEQAGAGREPAGPDGLGRDDAGRPVLVVADSGWLPAGVVAFHKPSNDHGRGRFQPERTGPSSENGR